MRRVAWVIMPTSGPFTTIEITSRKHYSTKKKKYDKNECKKKHITKETQATQQSEQVALNPLQIVIEVIAEQKAQRTLNYGHNNLSPLPTTPKKKSINFAELFDRKNEDIKSATQSVKETKEPGYELSEIEQQLLQIMGEKAMQKKLKVICDSLHEDILSEAFFVLFHKKLEAMESDALRTVFHTIYQIMGEKKKFCILKQFFEESIKLKLPVTAEIVHVIMKGFNKLGEYQHSSDTFDEMKEQGLSPPRKTTTLLRTAKKHLEHSKDK